MSNFQRPSTKKDISWDPTSTHFAFHSRNELKLSVEVNLKQVQRRSQKSTQIHKPKIGTTG